MKKRFSFFILIILVLILLSIPVAMVFFYRTGFENFEISDIDRHLEVIQEHAREYCDEYSEDESRFLSALSLFMTQHSEFGALIILDGDYEIILPEDPPSKEARRALAEDLAEAIQQGTLQNDSYFDTTDGLSLRISFSSLQRKSSGTLYVIAYYDTDRSSSQIDNLESIYLQIAFFSLIVFLGLAVMLYYIYYRQMLLLSEEILRIGTENFTPVAVPVSVGATDKVRRSINTVLEQLNRSAKHRETISRSVNHFMSNRLMAVAGYAQGIETGVFSPEEAAERIRMESLVMEDLIHNTSIQSFMREQTIPGNDEVLCLADEIEACFRKYSYIADRKNITLSMVLSDRDVVVRGTKSLLETVLDNLVSNAVRYASSKVTVSVEEAADQVIVRVKDDGKGIRNQDLAHIFQPLFKGPDGNFGIGLAVAQDAARYMNGSLKAENSPEGGAVFILSFLAL